MSRIAVVDDTDDNREILRIALADEYEIIEFGAAAELLEFLESNSVDLILCDIALPGMDGYELISILRQRGVLIPAIAVTAHTMSHHRQQALNAGFTDYLPKPVMLPQLLAMISRYLHSPRTSGASSGS
jgi:CheY-like chemotaxis protein